MYLSQRLQSISVQSTNPPEFYIKMKVLSLTLIQSILEFLFPREIFYLYIYKVNNNNFFFFYIQRLKELIYIFFYIRFFFIFF